MTTFLDMLSAGVGEPDPSIQYLEQVHPANVEQIKLLELLERDLPMGSSEHLPASEVGWLVAMDSMDLTTLSEQIDVLPPEDVVDYLTAGIDLAEATVEMIEQPPQSKRAKRRLGDKLFMSDLQILLTNQRMLINKARIRRREL